MNSETRNCQNCKSDFVIEPDDFAFYEKIKVPPPTFCWLCRAQRRFAFRNERALFKRKSDLSSKEIFATYPEEVPFPVYSQEEWFSDAWDPMSYGQDYDFSKSFFEQFKNLSDRVPKPAKSTAGFSKNSDYSNNFSDLKNCYLVFNSGYGEDCAYGNAVNYSSFCFDNTNVNYLELSYENFNCARCSRIFFSTGIVDSTDIFFSKNLRGCQNCFGCVNLRKKNYHIFNKPYSREDYFEEIKKFNIGSYKNLQEIRAKAERLWLEFPNKFREDGSKSVNVSGDYVYHSKNAHKIYQAIGGEDIKYCQYVNYPTLKDSYDFSVFGKTSSMCIECAQVGEQVYNCRFCLQSWSNIKNLEYCEYCQSSSDLFGCVSLRNKQYCILNKQYTKEEYEKLVAKIRNQMIAMPYVDKAGREYRYGEFFPAEFSPFGYNETIAQEHFPLSQEEAVSKKYSWKSVELKLYDVTKPVRELPDDINDINDSILNEVIGCSHEGKCDHGCTGAFRVIASELDFYKRFSVAFPRLCVSCRHRERLKKRNSIHLFQRKCRCAGKQSVNEVYQNFATHFHGDSPCPNEFETSYTPDQPQVVYCEQCYQAEVA